MISPPSSTASIPSIITISPFPPASTTPAFLSAGSSSGVLASDFSASETNARRNIAASPPETPSSAVFSQPSRATVRIVPSVGFMTDLYAASTPSFSAAESSAASAVSFPERPFESPLKISERITPEFPRAPRSIADAAVFATSPAVAPSGVFLSSATAFFIVMDIFVPVSPSGTGNTFSSSTV